MPTRDDYSLLKFLSRRYDAVTPSMSMRLESRVEFEEWREEFRRKLFSLLTIEPSPGTPPVADVGKREGLTDHLRERVVIETMDGLRMPAYVLLPKERRPERLPAAICLHGHVMGGKEGIAGVVKDRDAAEGAERMNGDYGLQVVRRGMIAFVPDVSSFNERLDEPVQGNSVCLKAFLNALLLGKNLLGLRVYEVFRAIDYLRSRDDVQREKIGCIGLSGGALQTLYAAALDERIAAAIVSGYLCTFRDSIFDIIHCPCNYVPGIADLCDMGEIAALIAPRPVFYESGNQDPIFPTKGAVAEYRRAQEAYKLLGAEADIEMDVFDGPHRFSGEKSLPWLERKLAVES